MTELDFFVEIFFEQHLFHKYTSLPIGGSYAKIIPS